MTRAAVPGANTIFNSAVVPFRDGFAGVFRVDDSRRVMNIHAGRSADGLDWDIDPEPIAFRAADDRVREIQQRFLYAYDPRVTWLEDRWYVTWCNGYHGPTIGIAYTDDFETFHQLDNAFLPFNRNGVLFPRRIRGSYAMLSRPSDDGHTPFGEIYYSESPDLVHWGRHRHVMSPIPLTWQSTKVGAGPTPIETDEGWLVLYHGVLTSCNGFVYSIGAALLDLDEPVLRLAGGRGVAAGDHLREDVRLAAVRLDPVLLRRRADREIGVERAVALAEQAPAERDPRIRVAEDPGVLLVAGRVARDLAELEAVARVRRLVEENAVGRGETLVHALERAPRATFSAPAPPSMRSAWLSTKIWPSSHVCEPTGRPSASNARTYQSPSHASASTAASISS